MKDNRINVRCAKYRFNSTTREIEECAHDEKTEGKYVYIYTQYQSYMTDETDTITQITVNVLVSDEILYPEVLDDLYAICIDIEYNTISYNMHCYTN